jgi:tRNA threonylcarbamoyladenosine biosynthesis protein TsaB
LRAIVIRLAALRSIITAWFATWVYRAQARSYNTWLMPTILSIETSASVGAVCVLRDGIATNEVVRDEAKLSAWLLPAIDRTLSRANVPSLDAIDAIAFGNGPGSFTGVRTACATAQALAYARGKPLYAVSSIEAIADSAISYHARLHRAKESVTVILDARMNEVFTAVYNGRSAEELACVSPVSLQAIDAVVNNVNEFSVGSGALLVAKRLGFESSRIDEIREITQQAETQWAESIARIALRRMMAGEAPIDPMQAEPEYVRNNVALTEHERRALRSNEVKAA